MSKHNWYVAKTGNDQGLIIEEDTGRNVAVSYKQEDARLIAAAPELLEACKDILFAFKNFKTDKSLSIIKCSALSYIESAVNVAEKS